MSEKPISEAALDVLASTRVEENIAYLPPVQLPRHLYEEVNDVLMRLGGKWKRGKGHVFEADPAADIQLVIQSGLMPPKNPLNVYLTPAGLASEMIQRLNAYLDIEPAMCVLEPSAGKGAWFFSHEVAAHVFALFTNGHSFRHKADMFWLACHPDRIETNVA